MVGHGQERDIIAVAAVAADLPLLTRRSESFALIEDAPVDGVKTRQCIATSLCITTKLPSLPPVDWSGV